MGSTVFDMHVEYQRHQFSVTATLLAERMTPMSRLAGP
jgi:hypothetical protein